MHEEVLFLVYSGSDEILEVESREVSERGPDSFGLRGPRQRRAQSGRRNAPSPSGRGRHRLSLIFMRRGLSFNIRKVRVVIPTGIWRDILLLDADGSIPVRQIVLGAYRVQVGLCGNGMLAFGPCELTARGVRSRGHLDMLPGCRKRIWSGRRCTIHTPLEPSYLDPFQPRRLISPMPLFHRFP